MKRSFFSIPLSVCSLTYTSQKAISITNAPAAHSAIVVPPLSREDRKTIGLEVSVVVNHSEAVIDRSRVYAWDTTPEVSVVTQVEESQVISQTRMGQIERENQEALDRIDNNLADVRRCFKVWVGCCGIVTTSAVVYLCLALTHTI